MWFGEESQRCVPLELLALGSPNWDPQMLLRCVSQMCIPGLAGSGQVPEDPEKEHQRRKEDKRLRKERERLGILPPESSQVGPVRVRV